ncbi:MAG: sigma-70 family RNA polymerase sigma factor [Acidobacteriota bacterium]|nr:sigma-70 family RNA polymerase sigma factor [Acidobacteriota bacterium]
MTDDAAKDRESWLVLRAQTGDAEAFDALLKSVQEPLYRYVSSLVRNAASAEDILQEVFLRVYRKLAYLREPVVFRPWAYRIASREAFRHLRRERRWADQLRDDAALKTIPQPPAREEFAPEAVERLPEMIAALSPASRAVVVLYYLDEMSLGEVAAVLEIPLGTVKSRLAYGLAALRAQLSSDDRQIGGTR